MDPTRAFDDPRLALAMALAREGGRQALAALSLRGLVHRLSKVHGDFHPWNILFCEPGDIWTRWEALR